METSGLGKEKDGKPAAARKRRRAPAEIRERILRAAGEAFELFGFSGATTLDIARRAEVTEAQLFRYFGSKQGLFHEAVFEPLVRHFDEFDARYVHGTPEDVELEDTAQIYIAELQQFVRTHSRLLMSVVVAQTYAPSATRGVNEIDSLQSYFTKGAAMMTRRTGGKGKISPKLMVRVSFATVLACVLFKDWMFPGELASAEDVGSAISAFVIAGITADDGRPEPAQA